MRNVYSCGSGRLCVIQTLSSYSSNSGGLVLDIYGSRVLYAVAAAHRSRKSRGLSMLLCVDLLINRENCCNKYVYEDLPSCGGMDRTNSNSLFSCFQYVV